MKAKFNIIFKNWPLTGKDVAVAYAFTIKNAKATAARWRSENPGATIEVQPA